MFRDHSYLLEKHATLLCMHTVKGNTGTFSFFICSFFVLYSFELVLRTSSNQSARTRRRCIIAFMIKVLLSLFLTMLIGPYSLWAERSPTNPEGTIPFRVDEDDLFNRSKPANIKVTQ